MTYLPLVRQRSCVQHLQRLKYLALHNTMADMGVQFANKKEWWLELAEGEHECINTVTNLHQSEIMQSALIMDTWL